MVSNGNIDSLTKTHRAVKQGTIKKKHYLQLCSKTLISQNNLEICCEISTNIQNKSIISRTTTFNEGHKRSIHLVKLIEINREINRA